MLELFDKFENDIKKRGRIKRLLLAIDQFFNVLFWNGSQDETISSHIYRRMQNGKANRFEKELCRLLRKIESSQFENLEPTHEEIAYDYKIIENDVNFSSIQFFRMQ